MYKTLVQLLATNLKYSIKIFNNDLTIYDSNDVLLQLDELKTFLENFNI